MQRLAKTPKVIVTVCLVAVVAIMAIIPTFAIVPPQPTGTSSDYQGANNVTEADADAITRMIGEMKTLGMFQFGDFVLVGRRGSTTRLFISRSGFTFTNNGTNIVISPFPDLPLLEYNFVAGGFQNNMAIFTEVSFALENVLCWWENDSLHINPDYAYGSAHSDSVINTSAGWHSYYLSVYNYDQNISDAREEGRRDGYTAGLEEGDSQGYERGYNEGSADGYNTGHAEGLKEGQANSEQRYQQGVVDGHQAGYSEGYAVGKTEGYEIGYREGVDYTYPIAYQEGYNDGVAHGGGITVVTEKLDIASIITSIPQAAKNIINRALDFEIFDINVAGTLMAVLVVAIVGFVVKWLMTR